MGKFIFAEVQIKKTSVIINIAIFILHMLLLKNQSNVTIKPTVCYESETGGFYITENSTYVMTEKTNKQRYHRTFPSARFNERLNLRSLVKVENS